MTTYTTNFDLPQFAENAGDKFTVNADALDLIDAALAAVSQFAPDNVQNLDANGALTGLTFGYLAGRVRTGTAVTDVARGTLAMSASSTNYVEVDSSGVVSTNTTGFTSGQVPLFIITTDASNMTNINDRRAWVTF